MKSRHNCVVVVANQVSDFLGRDEHAKPSGWHEEQRQHREDSTPQRLWAARRKEAKVAVMGLAWAQAISTRIVLSTLFFLKGQMPFFVKYFFGLGMLNLEHGFEVYWVDLSYLDRFAIPS